MLHRCYAIIETTEGQIVSNLIRKSQIVLCVAVGLIATISIQVLGKPLDQLVIHEIFKLPRLVLQQSYLVQMRLSCVILTKMEKAIRPSNPFARQLEERIQRAKPSLPECPIDNLLSSVASSQESSDSDTDELKKFLETKIREHLRTISAFWDRENNALYPYYSELRDVYDTLINIANSDLLEFDKAKDLIA